MTDSSLLVAKAIEIAHLLRLGAYLRAGGGLQELLKEIAETVSDIGPLRAETFTEIVVGIRIAQKSSDWLGMADWLEYELVTWLEEN